MRAHAVRLSPPPCLNFTSKQNRPKTRPFSVESFALENAGRIKHKPRNGAGERVFSRILERRELVQYGISAKNKALLGAGFDLSRSAEMTIFKNRNSRVRYLHCRTSQALKLDLRLRVNFCAKILQFPCIFAYLTDSANLEIGSFDEES